MRVIQYQCTEWLWKIVLFDPGSIQGSHRPIGILHDKTENARTIVCVKLSINNLVCLVHKNHIIRTCLMYHAACKIGFQLFKQVVLTADVFQLRADVFQLFIKTSSENIYFLSRKTSAVSTTV